MIRRNVLAICLFAAVAVTLVARPAEAAEQQMHDVERPTGRGERPPTGIGGVVAGSVLTGLGVLNLAYTPMCFVGGDFGLGAEGCMAAQLIGGGLFVLAGVPTLIAGGLRRKRYKRWASGERFALAPVITPAYSGLNLVVRF